MPLDPPHTAPSDGSLQEADAIASVAFVSLGCAKNLVDSERMLGLLAADGIAVTPDHADADAIVINTCGFLEASTEESMREIHEAIALKGAGRVKRIVVAGCLVQRHKTKLLAEAPGIDRLVGVFDRDHIVRAVRGEAGRQEGHFLGRYHALTRPNEPASPRGVDDAPPGVDDAFPGVDRGADAVDNTLSGVDNAPRVVDNAPRVVDNASRVVDNGLRVVDHAAWAVDPEQRAVDRAGRVVDPPEESDAARLLRKQSEGKRGQRLAVFEDDRGRFRLTPRHFAYLRMSEGCNQGCGFCTIPSIRGPMRSKPVSQILAEARELASDGAVELLLIGQDTTSYGTDIGYAPGLAGLLKTLDRELDADVAWIRLMYAYPSCFTDEMIAALAGCRRVLPYVDMPLQHISDAVLARMKRKVTRQQTMALLDKLREQVPGIAIRTTFIAGSPGETEAEHQELLAFIQEGRFEHVGVFPYSAEPGTPMGRMGGQVDEATKARRLEELMLAQQQVVFARNAARVGQTAEVLIDAVHGEADDGTTVYAARTKGQAPDIDSAIYVATKQPLHAGQFLDVRVTDFQHYDLVARVPRKSNRPLPVLAG